MQRTLIALAAAVALTGCSTTTAQLEQSPSTEQGVTAYAENYQEIYRRVHDTAFQCLSGNVIFNSSTAVVGQLFNELGYGEITYSLTNVGVKNYYFKAKIEKIGTGSKMTVFSGNTVNNAGQIAKLVAWAQGGMDC